MKLILCSDLHLSRRQTGHGRDPMAVLEAAIADITRHHRDADRIIMLGDLTETGDLDAYRHLRRAMSAVPYPCHLLIGNHDDRDAFSHVFPEAADPASRYIQKAIDLGPYRGLLLDTHRPGSAGGSLDDGRLDWLRHQLSTSQAPHLLFLHHPPLDSKLPAFETVALNDRAGLKEILQTYRPKIAAMFFGHCHLAISGLVAGVPAFGVPSLLYQSYPNFKDTRFVDAPELPCAYTVIMMDEQDLTVTTVPFGAGGAIVTSRNP